MSDIFSRFQTENLQHSTTNAYLCALLSYYIYDENRDGSDRIPGEANESFVTRFKNLFQGLSDSERLRSRGFFIDGTEVIVVDSDKGIWIVFRGTDGPEEHFSSISDILPNVLEGRLGIDRHANLAFEMQSVPRNWDVGGRVHLGYINSLLDVYEPLRSYVSELFQDRERPVFLTGHSKGGALATLCAYGFSYDFNGRIPVSGVYTFGAPRVGDSAIFVSSYGGAGLVNRTFRWIYNRDAGPALPFVSKQAMEDILLPRVRLIAVAAIPAVLLIPPIVTITAAIASGPAALIAAATIAVAFNETYQIFVPSNERYSHVGQCRLFKRNGEVLTDLDTDFSPHTIKNLFEANLIGIDSYDAFLTDHDAENYVRAMFSQLSSEIRLDNSSPSYLVREDVVDPFPTPVPIKRPWLIPLLNMMQS